MFIFGFDTNYFEIEKPIISLYFYIKLCFIFEDQQRIHFTVKELLNSFIIFFDFRLRDKLLQFSHPENLAPSEQ